MNFSELQELTLRGEDRRLQFKGDVRNVDAEDFAGPLREAAEGF